MSLALELLQRHEAALVWGVNDCVQFAADACGYYGTRRPSLPAYSSEQEARAIIDAGGGLAALVARELGAPIHPKDTRLGDVVLTVFEESGPMLGVADPPYFWVRAARGGFIPLKLTFAVEVWSCRAS